MSDTGMDQMVKERLEKIRNIYGGIPLVLNILSKRGDIFIPYSDLVESVFFQPKHLSMKTVELVAITAAAAIGSDHCLDVHIEQALSRGATEGEIFEAMMVGSMMAMTRSQSVAFRKLRSIFSDEKRLAEDEG